MLSPLRSGEMAIKNETLKRLFLVPMLFALTSCAIAADTYASNKVLETCYEAIEVSSMELGLDPRSLPLSELEIYVQFCVEDENNWDSLVLSCSRIISAPDLSCEPKYPSGALIGTANISDQLREKYGVS